MPDTVILEPSAPRMLPQVTDANRTFWTGGADGELRITRCSECRRWVLPLSGTCPECQGATRYEPTSGRATVFTYTLNAHQFHPDVPPPNLIAIVVLDEQEDLRLATNLVGCEEAEVRCGLPVRVQFEKHGEVYYPVFTPTKGQ
jgi:uncharacterized OB-fold protein